MTKQDVAGTPNNHRPSVVVLGPHRCGTSLLARLCGTAGYMSPIDSSTAATDNRDGHQEPLAVVALNEQLLGNVGYSWDTLAPPAAILSAVTATYDATQLNVMMAKAYRASYPLPGPAVVKDPRLSLMLPIWAPLLEQLNSGLRYLVSIRDPRSAAHSVCVRDQVSPNHALLTWCNYALSAFESTASHAFLTLIYPSWITHINQSLPCLAPHLLCGAAESSLLQAAARDMIRPDDVHSSPKAWVSTGLDLASSDSIKRLCLDVYDIALTTYETSSGPRSDDLVALRRRYDELTYDFRSIERHRSPRLIRVAQTATHLTHLHDQVLSQQSTILAITEELSRVKAAYNNLTRLNDHLFTLSLDQQKVTRDAKERAAASSRMVHDLTAANQVLVRQRDSAVAESVLYRDMCDEMRRTEDATRDLLHKHGRARRRLRSGMRTLRSRLKDAVRKARSQRHTFANRAMERERQHAQAIDQLSRELTDKDITIATTYSQLSQREALLYATEAQRNRLQYIADRNARRLDEKIYDYLYRKGGAVIRAVAPENVTALCKRYLPEPRRARPPTAFTAVTMGEISQANQCLATPCTSLPLSGSRGSDMVGNTQLSSCTESPQLALKGIPTRCGIAIASTAINHMRRRARLTAGPTPFTACSNKLSVSAAYARFYTRSGKVLRRLMPSSYVNAIKRYVPSPDGIPRTLGHVPMPVVSSTALQSPLAPTSATEETDIFVFSIIDWDFRTQRPQHLAKEWGDLGRRVFYIEMALAKGRSTIREVAPRVFVVQLCGKNIGHVEAYTGIPNTRQSIRFVEELYGLFGQVNASPSKRLFIQHPFWWSFLRHMPADCEVVFDCMDEISGFSNTTPELCELEEDLIARADAVIVTSQVLWEKVSRVRPATLIRNGADIAHFLAAEGPSVPRWLAALSEESEKIRIGYVGAIADWFDVDLIKHVHRLGPECEFHLCGAVTAPRAMTLAGISRIYLHGEIPYSDVPAFLRRMDVVVIPFLLEPIILACDPVKFYEYCAVKKPCVATRLPELARAGDLVTCVDTPEQFIKAIRLAALAGRCADRQAQLLAYACSNTWRQRAESFLAAADAQELVSVVLLHYGDIELTRRAVESVLPAQQGYRNIEVVVVNNTASKDVERVIEAWQFVSDVVRVVTPHANLGFAKGTNVGIEQSKGKFVLLLNNDTWVAPGAVRALTQHLQRNPKLGAVGPLTNNIGNEAKLDVSYSTMDEMMAVSRRVTRGYRNAYTELRTIAYFCVMFRRSTLDEVGGLAEEYGLGMFEDDDHCNKLHLAGYSCALAEDAFVHHELSATFDAMGRPAKQALFDKNRAIYEAKWGPWRPHAYRTQRPCSSCEDE